VDNEIEFISKVLDQWAYLRGVQLSFSRPGKPTDNPLIESFNSRFRAECLNEHWFLNLEDAGRIIEGWRTDYNDLRPHSSIGNRTPSQARSEYESLSCESPETLKPALSGLALDPVG
jgi:putative transposase